MKLQLTTLLLFATFFCLAQEKTVRVAFLKNNGAYVKERDSADYIRVISEPDSGSALYNVAEYYRDGSRKLVGKSSWSDHLVLEGQCARFYKNGKRQSTTNYKKGAETGLEYDFYPNGRAYLIKEYPDNNSLYNDLNNDFSIKANYDSLGAALVENGNGHYKGFDNNFKAIEEEGSVKNGKRDGLWNGYFKESKVHFSENYKDGKLIDGKSTFDDGTTQTYTTTRNIPPEFKGGMDAFSSFLSRKIEYPDDARENNIQGTVMLSFVVEKDGKVSDIKVSKSVSRTIDAEAVRVMKKCPPWLPGMQFGRPVRVAYVVPIGFALSGN
jgi:TonB family protein